jgi:hypothetical protein
MSLGMKGLEVVMKLPNVSVSSLAQSSSEEEQYGKLDLKNLRPSALDLSPTIHFRQPQKPSSSNRINCISHLFQSVANE